jgi:hypothetical protein
MVWNSWSRYINCNICRCGHVFTDKEITMQQVNLNSPIEFNLENGFDPVEKEIKSVTRAGYYPDKKSIIIKLVADKKNRRMLGAQLRSLGEKLLKAGSI